MQLPLQITFRNMPSSEAVEAKVKQRAIKLKRYFENILSCKVTIEAPHKHHHKGSIFQVNIDVSVPGKEIVVSRERGLNHAHEDIYVAVRDAFAAARRQLEEYTKSRLGKAKRLTGTVPQQWSEDDLPVMAMPV